MKMNDVTSPLAGLEDEGAFARRHIGTSPRDQAASIHSFAISAVLT